MNVFLDGLSILVNDWQLITGILVIITVISFPLFSRFKADPEPASSLTILISILFTFLSLILRLAFVFRATLPSYFDSAQHYRMIEKIMSGDFSYIVEMLCTNYYHVGFHFITAFFASIFQAEITTTMLVLGQVILAVASLPFFFVIRHMTRSNWAGMFAVVLSAFGWYMPSHVVDWGKYPALMSLGLVLFTLSFAYLFIQNKDVLHVRKRKLFYGAIGMSTIVAFFVHSRSIIVLGIVAVSWIMSVWWQKLPQVQQHLIFLLLFSVLVVEVAFIARLDMLSLLFDPYLYKGIWVTVLVLYLSAFAYKPYPQIVFMSFLTISVLLISLFIPVTKLLPGRDYLTLMDRPYVEMILFAPLSLLGGAGLAGLEKRIGYVYGRYVALLCIGLILFQTFANYEFYPSDCCVIVGNDDMAAMAWMENQLPVDSRIGISSMELKVVVMDIVEGYVGGDAGIWVTPLIDRATILLPYDLDFDKQVVLDILCSRGIDYLFAGELGHTFDNIKLNSRPEWYRPLLSFPKTRVYEIIGCD